MKKFLTMLVVLSAVCGAVNANEIDNPKPSLGMALMKTGSTIKLFYKGSESADVKISIYNTKGDKVFKETLRNIDNFVRPYNFSSLTEGEYTIELEGVDGKQVQRVNYTNGKIEKIDAANGKSEKLMNLLRVTGSPNKYILTVSNKGSEKLQVKIYNGKDQLIYNGTESIVGDFAKIYDLGAIGSAFLFEVTDQNGVSQSLSYILK